MNEDETTAVQEATQSAIDIVDNLTGLDKKDVGEVWSSRGKMAWVALWSMIVPTIYIIVMITNIELVGKLGDLMSWYYLSLASIVGAYFGFKAWSNVKGK